MKNIKTTNILTLDLETRRLTNGSLEVISSAIYQWMMDRTTILFI